MERIRRDTLLGLVFFGTLGFLLWATVNLTDLSLGAVPPLEVYFPEAGSADVGTNVMVLGKKVGKVGAIDVVYERTENPVRMQLLLREKIPLTSAMLIEVRDAGVLGGKQIYIDPGRGAPLPPNTELRGKAEKGAFERIGDIADGQGELGESLNSTLASIRTFFDHMNDKESTVGQLTQSRVLHDEILLTVQRLDKIFEAIQGGRSPMGRLAMDTAMGERVQFLIDNLAQASEALTRSEGTIGMLLNDQATATNLRAIVADIAALTAQARAGDGTVGKLFTDKVMAQHLADSLASLDTLLQKANDPNAGVVGALTSDPATAENVRVALANVRDVTDSLRRGEGALGVLINDKDVGIRLRRIFTQVSRALEDAREAAPISNFVQVLLGTF
ncbi:MAG: MCE family protein [Planctomycetes bacterium]|nr:MCE family protein [Planctomycetota bacterium]